jgi:hypothetical protein
MSTNKTRVGAVLIILCPEFRFCKGRYNLESCDGCLWVEMHALDSLNMLIFNRYFPLPPIVNMKLLLITFAFRETSWIPKIFMLLSLQISALMVSTGNMVCLLQTDIIIRNYEGCDPLLHVTI